jgi:hypothetical protein
VLPMQLFMMVAMRILMPIAIQALEDIVGEELALLVAVVASFYMGAAGDTGTIINGVAQAGLTAVGGASQLYFKDAMEEITKDIESLSEATEELAEAQAETDRKVASVINTIKSDPYQIMDATHYVRKFRYSTHLPTMITATTERFTDMMLFVDKPDSYIRLGN